MDSLPTSSPLASAPSFLAAVLENVADGVVACDANGVLTTFNRATREFHGLPHQAIPSEEWAKHYSLKNPDGTLMSQDEVPLFRALRGEVVKDLQLFIESKDQVRVLSCNGHAIFDEAGKKLGAVVTMHDVTKERAAAKVQAQFSERLEEMVELRTKELQSAQAELQLAKEGAEQANQLKSSFLANMSHEIRTPLGAMLGYADLLASPDLSLEDSRSFIDTIKRNGKALTQIIDDILDLSKVEADRIEIKKSPVNLRLLIEDVLSLLKVQVQDKHIALEAKPINPLLSRIKTDPLRVRQILINLVGNAVKFTKKGKISVEVSKTDDQLLRISVSDSGIGIPKELQPVLFKPFMQVDNTYTRQFAGTGLGLALSKKLAQAMGGDVLLENSEPNVGSVFAMTLPFDLIETEPSQVPEAVLARTQRKDLSGVRVLLVDDSSDNRFLVNRMLSLKGASIVEATNGEEAVTTAMSTDIEIILMDVQMPVMDGLEATRELRRRGFTKPIVALTAHALVEERERCLKAGANVHIVKPINFPDLINSIKLLVKADG